MSFIFHYSSDIFYWHCVAHMIVHVLVKKPWDLHNNAQTKHDCCAWILPLKTSSHHNSILSSAANGEKLGVMINWAAQGHWKLHFYAWVFFIFRWKIWKHLSYITNTITSYALVTGYQQPYHWTSLLRIAWILHSHGWWIVPLTITP